MAGKEIKTDIKRKEREKTKADKQYGEEEEEEERKGYRQTKMRDKVENPEAGK